MKVLQEARKWLETRMPRGQFWVYFCVAAFFNFGFSVFFFLFNVYLLSRGLNEASLGIIGSSAAVGTLCGTIPAGILAERKGLRWTLTCGIGLACVVSALRVIVAWMPAQLALAVVGGFALSSWAVCLSPAVAGLTTEEQRPTAFSLMFASGIGVAGLGGLASGYLPGYVRSRAHSLTTVEQSEFVVLLLACAIAGLALVPISGLTLRSTVPRTRLLRPTGPFLRSFLLAMTVWALVTGAFPPFANVYFVHHLGFSLEAMGSVFSLSQMVQFGAILAAPLLLRSVGLVTGVMTTQFATAATLFLLAGTQSPSHAAQFYWAYMTAQCMNEPGIYSLLMKRVPPEDRNGASSYTFFVSAGSQIIASSAVGFLIVRFNYSIVLCGVAMLAIVAALLFRRLPEPHREETESRQDRTCLLIEANVTSLSRSSFSFKTWLRMVNTRRRSCHGGFASSQRRGKDEPDLSD